MKKIEKSEVKIIKVKDIMRLFLKYDVDYIPIIDNAKKLKGLIDKNLIIQKAVDGPSIDKPFFKNINNYMFYPDEDEFLRIVGNLKDTINFPVVSTKGLLLFLWFKKDLLNIYYNIYSKSKTDAEKNEVDFKEILDILPFNLLIINSKAEITYANEKFLNQFDFDKDILLNQPIIKFFPKIQTVKSKEMLYPKTQVIYYRHVKWFYTVFNLNQYFIYLFSIRIETFQDESMENFVPVDKIDVNLKDFKKEEKIITKSLPDILDSEEYKIIKDALELNEWNITKTAKTLNVPRQTLQYKISKYKIS